MLRIILKTETPVILWLRTQIQVWVYKTNNISNVLFYNVFECLSLYIYIHLCISIYTYIDIYIHTHAYICECACLYLKIKFHKTIYTFALCKKLVLFSTCSPSFLIKGYLTTTKLISKPRMACHWKNTDLKNPGSWWDQLLRSWSGVQTGRMPGWPVAIHFIFAGWWEEGKGHPPRQRQWLCWLAILSWWWQMIPNQWTLTEEKCLLPSVWISCGSQDQFLPRLIDFSLVF